MKKWSFLSLCFSAVLLFTSCTKEGKEGTTNESKFPYYFSATVNGKAVKYEANDLNSRFECGISSPSAAIGDEYDAYEGTFIQDSQDMTKNNISVYILKHFSTGEPTYNQRLAMFKVGSYNYGKIGDNGAPTQNGASITYTDENGIEWDSEGGSQAGSTFAITEITDNKDGTSEKIMKVTFSCKLYDDIGRSIQLTNGTISGKILFP